MEVMKIKLGNPQEDAPPKRIKRITNRKKLLLLGIAAAVVLIVLIIALPGSSIFGGIRRTFTYARLDKDENRCAELYQYAGEKKNSFAAVDDGLVLASVGEIQVMDESGAVRYADGLKFHEVAISRSTDRTAVYDIGGTEVYVVNVEGLLHHIICDGTILTANLNEKGWLAVTVNKSGYKAAVYVYDPDGELTFEFDSSERFVMTASVSRDGREMAAVTMGQEKGTFVSSVVFYKLNQNEPYASCDLPGDAVYHLGLLRDNYCAVAENALYFIGKNGKIHNTYDFGGDFLRRCSFSDEEYAVVQLADYKSGSQGRLVTVDAGGREIASLDIKSEVLHLSTAGNYVAVLFSDHLTVYNRRLKEIATLENISFAREALIRKDGSAILAGNDRASLYLP